MGDLAIVGGGELEVERFKRLVECSLKRVSA